MVNVTKENFIEQSNDLIHHLQTAAFVAIDEEMTGIQLPSSSNNRRKDLPPKATYPDLKLAPERYSIIQLGVSLFHSNVPDEAVDTAKEEDEDEEEEGRIVEDAAESMAPDPEVASPTTPEPTWTVRSYNFYMFPAASGRWDDAASVREIVLSPSSVSFLNEHNMSFDLWTKQGVNYVTGDRAAQIISDYTTKHQQDTQTTKVPRTALSVDQTLRRSVELTRTEDVRFFASAMATLREWLDNASATNQPSNSLLLPSCNSFLRRALYENIEREYPELVLENGGGGHIRVLRMSTLEKLEREQELKRDAWRTMILNVGMWRVFDALSRACRGAPISMQSPLFAPSFDAIDFDAGGLRMPKQRRVPLVVHNGFMDILFLMTHFDAPMLPESLSDCKQLIANYFPVIYDTKVVSTEHTTLWGNEQTNLANLYNSVVRENQWLLSKISVVSSSGEDTQQEHEAAYDAFMTGSIYLGLCKHIAHARLKREMKYLPVVGELLHLLGDSDEPLASACDQRENFGRNKIYQMSMFTLDLQNTKTDMLKRGMMASASYHVSGIDPSVATRDIVRCCADLADSSGRKVEFNIIWVDNTTFIVAATLRPENAEEEIASETEMTVMLRNHGDILRHALKVRFANQEKVVSLEEHFDSQVTADNIHNTNWFGRAMGKVASMLGYESKRKAEGADDCAPSTKRRRYN